MRNSHTNVYPEWIGQAVHWMRRHLYLHSFSRNELMDWWFIHCLTNCYPSCQVLWWTWHTAWVQHLGSLFLVLVSFSCSAQDRVLQLPSYIANFLDSLSLSPRVQFLKQAARLFHLCRIILKPMGVSSMYLCHICIPSHLWSHLHTTAWGVYMCLKQDPWECKWI